ncbi:hypothetical protein DXG01_003082 [Tephrocybe rancida]|nr:hypothetical protein DXG01_003082 [Tephrocybe rancida]
MDLPSSRELELETLLRLRDTQLTELTDELTHLRHTLLSQPGPSSTEPTTLPAALVSVLSPHLHAGPPSQGAPGGSNTVNAALTQRARALQDENDELYELLKVGETGKLKEEVRGLRRVVARLEGALRESHQAIATLSTELDKSYNSLLTAARPSTSEPASAKSISQSPRAAYHPMLPGEPNGPNNAKLPPTGPRAHKKPRLAETPPQRAHAPLPPQHKSFSNRTSTARMGDTREYPPRRGKGGGGGGYVKMEVDDDQRGRPPSIERERERDRDRDRERDRERERDRGRDREHGARDRERDGHGGGRHRRNGGGGAGRGGGGGRGNRDHTQTLHDAQSGDRTLRERMGL